MKVHASNEYTANCQYVWAPVGAKAVSSTPTTQSKRYSILPAYIIDGYLAWHIYEGSYNADQYMEFIQDELLPLYNPFPEHSNVCIMDNASIHIIQLQVQYLYYCFIFLTNI